MDENGNEALSRDSLPSDRRLWQNYASFSTQGAIDDEDVELQAYSFTEGEDGQFESLPIEDEKEWDMVEEVLNTFLDEEGNF